MTRFIMEHVKGGMAATLQGVGLSTLIHAARRDSFQPERFAHAVEAWFEIARREPFRTKSAVTSLLHIVEHDYIYQAKKRADTQATRLFVMATHAQAELGSGQLVNMLAADNSKYYSSISDARRAEIYELAVANGASLEKSGQKVLGQLLSEIVRATILKLQDNSRLVDVLIKQANDLLNYPFQTALAVDALKVAVAYLPKNSAKQQACVRQIFDLAPQLLDDRTQYEANKFVVLHTQQPELVNRATSRNLAIAAMSNVLSSAEEKLFAQAIELKSSDGTALGLVDRTSRLALLVKQHAGMQLIHTTPTPVRPSTTSPTSGLRNEL